MRRDSDKLVKSNKGNTECKITQNPISAEKWLCTKYSVWEYWENICWLLKIYIFSGGNEHLYFKAKVTLQKHKSPGWAYLEIMLISESF